MPAWEDWDSLFIKGIVIVVIYIIYMIIPLIILAATIGGSIVSVINSNDPNAVISALGGAFAGISVSLILILIISLMLPMALAIYAKEESFGAAFRIGEILSRIKSVIGSYILAFIVIFVLSMILGMVSIIPILGWIILIFGNFYIATVGAHMFGKLYSESSA